MKVKKNPTRNDLRKKRHLKIRKKIFGTRAIPRISIFKSKKHLYVQIIDDENNEVICSASSLNFKTKVTNNISHIPEIVNNLFEKMKEKNIERAVFDRSGYIYHGKVQKVAEILREKGIKI